MSNKLTTTGAVAYIDGLLVNHTNLINDNLDCNNEVGEAVVSILGLADIQPAYMPCSITPNGLTLTVGGSNQLLFLQGRLCDNIPATTIQVPTTSTAARIDLVAAMFSIVPTLGVLPDQEYQSISGADSMVSLAINYRTVLFDYVEGTEGSGVAPATPAGYEAFATVAVAHPTVSITPSNITYLFETPLQALTGSKNPPVTSVNAFDGAITIEGGTGVAVTEPSSGIIQIALTSTPVASINGETGAITILGGSGISVTQPSASQIEITSTVSTTTINGEQGAVTISANNGITFAYQGGTSFLISTTLVQTSVNGIEGAVTIQGNGSTITTSTSGGTISIGTTLTETSFNGVSGVANLVSPDGSITISPSGSTIDLYANVTNVAGNAVIARAYIDGSASGTLTLALPGSGNFHVTARLSVSATFSSSTCTYTLTGNSGISWSGSPRSGSAGISSGSGFGCIGIDLYGEGTGGETASVSWSTTTGAHNGYIEILAVQH